MVTSYAYHLPTFEDYVAADSDAAKRREAHTVRRSVCSLLFVRQAFPFRCRRVADRPRDHRAETGGERGGRMTRIVELIYTDSERRGDGTASDPNRIIRQLFSKKGMIVAWYDPHTKDSFFNPGYSGLDDV